ncbi:MAG TPA: O-antigen ligase family protein [Solirubrobacteraceae bacterium]
MRRAALTAVQAGLLLLPVVLAFFSGAFFEAARLIAAICAWALLALAALAVPGLPLPGARPARLALAALAGLAAWTWIASSWSSSPAGADQELELALLYLPALAAGAVAWSDRRAARMVEPALAAGALLVIGYGLSGRLLPGVVHLHATARAGGRLEQPLTYWNATGALAAMGLVLCARLAGDVSRPRALRIAAAAAAAPLGMGAYLSFSRGAIACLLAGLAALVAFDRTRAQLRAAAIALGAGALAGAAAAPFGAVRALHPAHATAQGLAVLVLLAAIAAGAALLQARGDAQREPLRLRTAPIVAVVVALALLPYVAVVLAERGGPSRDAAFGATNARLSDVGTHRLSYWRVAVDVAADHPLAGAGPGAFAVEWLRRRTIDERVRNAHSLELQTLADLGLVGLALLAAVLAATALAARRVLHADRALAAGPAAAALTWALHAGLDWDWEMPAVTLVAVALAGLLLCRAGAADGAHQLGEQGALEAQGQRDDDGAEERELGDRLGLRPA